MHDNVNDKGSNPCTGCGVCAIACPQNCINIKFDVNGFLSPYIDILSCSHCGICKTVCYKYIDLSSINPRQSFKNKKVLAVINNYLEQLNTVTTAGVASSLSSYFMQSKYNVCGAIFDIKTDTCHHIATSSKNSLNLLKGSKYLQSNTQKAFSEVIFTDKPAIVFGTPCQIFGFRKEINRRGIENQFVLVDFFCRGVPTHHLWSCYKSYIQDQFNLGDFKTVNFRDKSTGWHSFGMKISDVTGKEYKQTVYNDLFYYFYLRNLVMNPACYNCKFRHDLSSADIRLGDFWGAKYKSFNDGVGLVILLTSKGENLWSQTKFGFRYENCTTEDIYISQKIGTIPMPDKYAYIISLLNSGTDLKEILASHNSPNKLTNEQQ